MRQRMTTGQVQGQASTSNTEDLLRMKQELDEKKTQVSTLEGKKQALYQRLKDEFDCDTVQEADTIIQSMDREITDKERDLAEKIDALKKNYQWDFAQ